MKPFLQSCAKKLDTAIQNKQPINLFSESEKNLSIEDAYRIQAEGIVLRQQRHEKFVGYKLGLTSKAKQEQMHVNLPIYGTLTNVMRVKDGEKIALSDLIHPKVEAEVGLILEKPLKGIVTPEEALAACSGVCAAIDIIDIRYHHYRFGLFDVIADNCAAGKFIFSETVLDPRKIDFSNLSMKIFINDKLVESGTSHAIMEGPINSLVLLSKLLHAENKSVPAGSVILCGAAMNALDLAVGMSVRLEVEKLGSVGFSC